MATIIPFRRKKNNIEKAIAPVDEKIERVRRSLEIINEHLEKLHNKKLNDNTETIKI